MRKKVVVIKSDSKNQGFWCEVKGNEMELVTSHFALTENIIKLFKDEENGKEILTKTLLDTIKIFAENGIYVTKDMVEDERNNNN